MADTTAPRRVRHKRHIASCTECKRRKQKCSRTWPCDHCMTRGLPHLCQFVSVAAVVDNRETTEPPKGLQLKKGLCNENQTHVASGTSSAVSGANFDPGMEALGYMTPQNSHQNDTTKISQDSLASWHRDSAAVKRAIEVLPPRSFTDILIEAYLAGGNYQYYILHPPTFRDQYNLWWVDRVSRLPLSAMFTCLVLRVCACSLQSLETSKEQTFETELGESIQTLTEKYHNAAQDLSRSISPGIGGLHQVQQLALATSWLKSEARFIDCWHELGATIRTAQEIGMHDPRLSRDLTEFDKEMRRRIWCLLYVWDWKMSVTLSRPRILNLTDSLLVIPTLRLETNAGDSGGNPPSPIAQLILDCNLIQKLSMRFKVPLGQLSQEDTLVWCEDIQSWMASFPPFFGVKDPDTQFDTTHPFISLQRAQLHATSYAIMLHPLKVYLTRSPNTPTKIVELGLRSAGVDCCLNLIDSLKQYFDLLFPRQTKLHFIVWGVFDVAAVVCSAMKHDSEAHSLPRREALIESMTSCLDILRDINNASRSGILPYSILGRLVETIPLTNLENDTLENSPRKRIKIAAVAGDQELINPGIDMGPSEYQSTANRHEEFDPNLVSESVSGGNFAEIANLLDWDALDLELPL